MKNVSNFTEVPIDKLRWRCDPDSLGFETTEELKLQPAIIGQKRAVNALRIGLDIESLGYNIFVAGPVGTGRKTAVTHLLKETERFKRLPDDKCYVNNFKNPDEPILIRLKAGQGRGFKKDMDELIEYLVKNIPLIFKSEDYQKKRKEIIEKFKKRQNELVKNFEKEASKENFTLVQLQVGPFARPDIVPIIDGKSVNFQELSTLVEKGKFSKTEFAKLEQKRSKLVDELESVLKEIRDIEKAIHDKLRELDYGVATPLIERKIDEIKDKYLPDNRQAGKNEKINQYLDEVKNDIIENLDRFQEKPERETPLDIPPSPIDLFLRYRVNLIVDNYGAKRAPVIFETSPTYRNLFGAIEAVSDRFGQWRTDFTRIKAGSIIRADGGYLIIEALDALIEPGVWSTLKRTLRNRKAEIQNYTPFYMLSMPALKPEPVECDVKVVMVGDYFLYNLLYEHDEDFKKIFKIRADFDSVMDINTEAIKEYANFIKKICSQEKLIPFDKGACASVIEYGVRISGRQSKLSTHFNQVADLLREANHWAHKEGSSIVTNKHVEKAIDEKIERSRLIEEKIQELIEDGTIMIDTSGNVIGQVNGLSVYDTGDYTFGKPSRITAKTSVGSSGIIDIEREAELSGRIHSKGVLILAGYLRSKYAQDKPLAMSASLCFEQSYTGVEGDSASSSEVYALLSSLSELPIRQDIAVTGSVNQKGEIQSIGGVNQKIEGFYDVCKAKGLTGTQGVIIPYQNINDLMLRKDVIEAVKKGKFHIYPVKTIDEGIEILTGMKAGERTKDGEYEDGTVNWMVDRKLREFANKWRDFRLGEGSERTNC
ncbi:MAG: ATP-binding protein [bacterium]|nr:ATP-binding protein [bacterium]